jgi:hypothetical protein
MCNGVFHIRLKDFDMPRVKPVEHPNPVDDKVSIAATVPRAMADKLDEIAAREERSRSAIIGMALRAFVEKQP